MFWQILSVAIGCSIKPLIFIPAARVAGVSGFATFIGASIGGCAGVVFFVLILDFIAKKVAAKRRLRLKHNEKIIPRTKKIFTKRNRFIVNIMNKYGLMGIAAIAPLLSIPLAAFIAGRVNDKFIKDQKKVIIYLCLSMVIWSFIMVSITRLF